MGLFDQLAQAVSEMTGGGGNNQLLKAATQMLGQSGQGGGLAGLVQAFQKNGTADIVNMTPEGNTPEAGLL